jgi:ribA/ribD-fused uncharacterized protein
MRPARSAASKKPRAQGPEERTYHRAECAVFFKTKEQWGGLSNMAGGYPLRVAGVRVPSSEALYQACRYPHMPDVQRKILAEASAMTAKMVGKPYRQNSRVDWDDVRVGIMKWCLKVKLQQHPGEFGRLLLATGERPIVEQSRRDSYWGAIPEPNAPDTLVGQNVLGRLLMALRETYRASPDAFAIIEPVPIEDFVLLDKSIETLTARGATLGARAGIEATPFDLFAATVAR